MRLMVRVDGTLQRGPEELLAPVGNHMGTVVIEDGDSIHDTGLHVSMGVDFDPPTMYYYDATLFAADDRLLVRVVQNEDYGRTTTSLRISEDGGRTWHDVTTAPALDEWRVVDQL